jgi:SAM-dependent methyltransferase
MKINNVRYRLGVRALVGTLRCSLEKVQGTSSGISMPRPRPSLPGWLFEVIRQIEGMVNLVFPIDLHSVLRYENVISTRILDSHLDGKSGAIVTDVGGCLNFALLFLSRYAARVGKYYLLVYDDCEARLATEHARSSRWASKIVVIRGDATSMDTAVPGKSDVVFMVDVLEHVPDDAGAIRQVYANLKRHGVFLISVPTPRYRVFFGNRFHRFVGHVRDGYTQADLDDKLARFAKIRSTPYANSVTSFVMRPFYRYMPGSFVVVAAMYLSTFVWLKYVIVAFDRIFPARNCSSLFYACEKL